MNLVSGILATLFVLCPVEGPINNTPTTDPPYPTYIVQGDGTRVQCGPGYRSCDWG